MLSGIYIYLECEEPLRTIPIENSRLYKKLFCCIYTFVQSYFELLWNCLKNRKSVCVCKSPGYTVNGKSEGENQVMTGII